MSGTWSEWLLWRDVEVRSTTEQRVIDRLLDLAKVLPGDRMADLGAGHGTLAFAAAPMVGPGGRIICIDADAQALAEAERRAAAARLTNLDFMVADAGSVPLKPGSLDAVAAKSLFYSLADRASALEEAFRVLKPGGRLALFEPLLRRETVWSSVPRIRLAEVLSSSGHPAFTLNRDGLRREVETVGFRDLRALTWHAEVTRVYANVGEVLEEWAGLLPGDLSLSAVWKRAGVTEAELATAAESLHRDSEQSGFRDLLPCLFLGARKPESYA